MRRLTFAVAAALIAVGSAAHAAHAAHAAQPRIRGTIAAVKGSVVTIKTRDGNNVTVDLSPGYTVGSVAKASLSDIKPGSYVGSTTIPRRDGSLVAIEVHIFPPSKRGAGEGSRPWDLAPHSMMTNADVTGSVNSASGRVLTLTYKGGQKKIVVTPRTAIVFLTNGVPADVTPGVGVVVVPDKKNADGSFEASRVTVGKGGVNPAD